MNTENILYLAIPHTLKAQNGGLFVSRGGAMHPTRVIASHELIFVKQGVLDMWEEDQIFHLEEGDTLHLWPHRRHGSTQVMPPDLKFYWIHFELGTGGQSDTNGLNEPLTTPITSGFSSVVQMPQTNHIAKPEKLEQLFRMFLEDQEAGTLQPCEANLLVLLMLIEASRRVEESVVEQNEIKTVATWAHTYIKLNYDRPISAQKVAQAIGYNVDYVGRLYRKMYKCTLTEAIHRRRIHAACQYLLDTQVTIDQISDKCGFSDPDYFRRIFRRYMHISPGIYRKEYSQIHVNTH